MATTSASKSFTSWEDSTGLLSSLIPQANGSSTSFTNPQAFNTAAGELKLGPAPISEELRAEAEKSLREQAMMDRDPTAQYDNQLLRPTPAAGIVSPTTADLLPHPPTFKTVDVKREVERVRDARKRIRLDPSTLSAADGNASQGAAARQLSLPSICAYTLHDVHEGFVQVRLCCQFLLTNHHQLSMLYVLAGHVTNGGWFRGKLHSIMEFEGRAIKWSAKRLSA